MRAYEPGGEGNRDARGRQVPEDTEKGETQRAPSQVDKGTGVRQKPRERQSERSQEQKCADDRGKAAIGYALPPALTL